MPAESSRCNDVVSSQSRAIGSSSFDVCHASLEKLSEVPMTATDRGRDRLAKLLSRIILTIATIDNAYSSKYIKHISQEIISR